MHLEVNQIGEKGFLIRLLCEKKQGGFVRLMEALDSLELQVVNANLTTVNGRVQNILEVKVRIYQGTFLLLCVYYILFSQQVIHFPLFSSCCYIVHSNAF